MAATAKNKPKETLGDSQGEVKEEAQGMPNPQGGATEAPKKPIRGTLKAAQALLMGSSRLSFHPYHMPTGTVLEIPKGHMAIITLDKKLAELSRVRLVNPVVLFEEDSGFEVILVLENIGSDPYMFHKGDPLANLVVFKYQD